MHSELGNYLGVFFALMYGVSMAVIFSLALFFWDGTRFPITWKRMLSIYIFLCLSLQVLRLFYKTFPANL